MSPNLRIGIICYPKIGGSGIIATELGHELAELGHKIHFISYSLPFRLQTNHPNIRFHEVSVNDYSLFKYPDYTLPLAVEMAQAAEEHNLDILHAHYAVPHATSAYLAQQMLKSRGYKGCIITTLHGTDITLMSKDSQYKPIIEFSINNSCGVTAVSQSLKEQSFALLNIKKEIQVIHNFHNPRQPSISRRKMRESLHINENELLLIHSSNARPVKRIPDLLKTISQIKNQDKVKLLILCGGNFASYSPLLKKLNIEKKVIIKTDIIDIENYLNAADIGIYTSEQESFGLGILETMAAGHPVLGTTAGGIPEVIKNNETGYTFEIGDSLAFAKAIDSFIENKSLLTKMGISARKRASSSFSSKKIVGEYIEYYRKILDSCHPS